MIKYINNHYSSLTGKRLLGEFLEYRLSHHRIIQDYIDIHGISGVCPELHILLAEFLYLRTLNHDLLLQRLDHDHSPVTSLSHSHTPATLAQGVGQIVSTPETNSCQIPWTHSALVSVGVGP